MFTPWDAPAFHAQLLTVPVRPRCAACPTSRREDHLPFSVALHRFRHHSGRPILCALPLVGVWCRCQYSDYRPASLFGWEHYQQLEYHEFLLGLSYPRSWSRLPRPTVCIFWQSPTTEPHHPTRSRAHNETPKTVPKAMYGHRRGQMIFSFADEGQVAHAWRGQSAVGHEMLGHSWSRHEVVGLPPWMLLHASANDGYQLLVAIRPDTWRRTISTVSRSGVTKGFRLKMESS